MEKTLSLFFALFRATTAILLLIHGVARIWLDAVEPFGIFLQQIGLPPVTAWVLTIFEIVGSILMIVNRWSGIMALAFIAELIAGIVLVHGKFGWFVVGHSYNGVEYSIALINSLLLVWAFDQYTKKK